MNEISTPSNDTQKILTGIKRPGLHNFSGGSNTEDKIKAVFSDFLQDSCHEIMRQRVRRLLKIPGKTEAYISLKSRKIYPSVAESAEVGVVSHRFDLASRLEEAVGAETGFESFIEEARKLINMIGWFVFPFRNAEGELTQLKFRKPNSGNFFELQIIAGGRGLFLSHPLAKITDVPLDLFLVVDELESMAAISLLPYDDTRRWASVGSAKYADFETVRNISRKPYVIAYNDSAGNGFVEEMRQHSSFFQIVLPDGIKDLDEYLKSIPEQAERQKAFEQLVREAKPCLIPLSSVKETLINMRDENMKGAKKSAKIREYVYEVMKDRGGFYKTSDANVFYHDTASNIIYEIPHSQGFSGMLCEIQLVGSDNITKGIKEYIYHSAMKEAEEKEIYRFCFYNRYSHTIYLYAGPRVIKISSDGAHYVDNGADGVLFMASCAIGFEPEIDEKVSCEIVSDILFKGVLFDEDTLPAPIQKAIAGTWFLSLFFPQMMAGKPVLMMSGVKGSGKSFFPRRVGKLLFGKKFDIASPPESAMDFDCLIYNNYLTTLDNLDSNIAKWLPDKICVVATGGLTEKRKLYSDNETVQIRLNNFLAITTREPGKFSRDDVADRLLSIKLERREEFISESKLLAKMEENRPVFMTALINKLSTICVLLSLSCEDSDYSGIFRMADYGSFMKKIETLLAVPPEYDTEKILTAYVSQRNMDVLENRPVVGLLFKMVENDRNYPIERNAENLLAVLNHLNSEGVSIPQSARALGQFIKNQTTELAEYFDIKTRTGGGRVRYYTFVVKPGKEVQE